MFPAFLPTRKSPLITPLADDGRCQPLPGPGNAAANWRVPSLRRHLIKNVGIGSIFIFGQFLCFRPGMAALVCHIWLLVTYPLNCGFSSLSAPIFHGLFIFISDPETFPVATINGEALCSRNRLIFGQITPPGIQSPVRTVRNSRCSQIGFNIHELNMDNFRGLSPFIHAFVFVTLNICACVCLTLSSLFRRGSLGFLSDLFVQRGLAPFP